MSYQCHDTPRFEKDLATYPSLRERIWKQVQRITAAPYTNTEKLGHPANTLNLKGCPSAHVGRNFRIIFVICEECRAVPECQYCFCDGLPDQTIVFLTVRPHAKAYTMR